MDYRVFGVLFVFVLCMYTVQADMVSFESELVEGRYIVVFDTPAQVKTLRATADLSAHDRFREDILASEKTTHALDTMEFTKTISAMAVTLSDEQFARAKKLPYVQSIQQQRRYQIFLEDSIPYLGIDKVWNASLRENTNITGAGISIAILDSGVDYLHPDLGGCFGPGCKVVGGYDVGDGDSDPMDSSGHGTHVAATAAGNGTLKGVAPDAEIYAYKVFGSQGSFDDRVLAAIELAVDPNEDGDFSDHVDIISMSIGSPGNPNDALSAAVDAATQIGVVFTIAPGNSGPGGNSFCRNESRRDRNSVCSPGSARSAITVGASCMPHQVGVESSCDERVASFSSRGPTSMGTMKPDVVAPGVGICAARYSGNTWYPTCLNGDHARISGTSMATPHVAGAVALIKQAHPDWSAEQIKYALRLSAHDLGLAEHVQGHGEINVLGAINVSEVPIARLKTYGDHLGNSLEVKGDALSNDFQGYTLSYKEFDTSNWVDTAVTLENGGSSQVDNDTLAAIDLTQISYDEILLRLSVSTSKNTSHDYSYIKREIPTVPDAFEPDNSIADANEITVGQTQRRDFSSTSDLDYVFFDAQQDVYYRFEVPHEELGVDVRFRLFDSNGNLIRSDWGRYAGSLTYRASSASRFYVEISNAGSSSGEYSVKLQTLSVDSRVDSYEPDSDYTQATPLIVGTDQDHTLYPMNDVDYYSFQAVAQTKYSITTKDLQGADTYMFLYDTDGTTLLARNDDRPPGLHSQINFTAQTSGTYFVQVRPFSDDIVFAGSYSIVLSSGEQSPVENRPFDLDARNLYTNKNPIVGKKGQLNFAVENEAAHASDEAEARLYVYNETDEAYRLAETVNVSSLNAFERRVIEINWTPSEIGEVVLRAEIFSENDTDYTNNNESLYLEVRNSGLDLSASFWPEDAILNQKQELSIYIRSEAESIETTATVEFFDFLSQVSYYMRKNDEVAFQFENKEVEIVTRQLRDDLLEVNLEYDEQSFEFLARPWQIIHIDHDVYLFFDFRREKSTSVYMYFVTLEEKMSAQYDSANDDVVKINWTPKTKGDHRLVAIVKAENDNNKFNNARQRYVEVNEPGPNLDVDLDIEEGSSGGGGGIAIPIRASFFADESKYFESIEDKNSIEINQISVGSEIGIEVEVENEGTQTSENVRLAIAAVADTMHVQVLGEQIRDFTYDGIPYNITVSDFGDSYEVVVKYPSREETIVLNQREPKALRNAHLIALDYVHRGESLNYYEFTLGKGQVHVTQLGDIDSYQEKEYEFNWTPQSAGSHRVYAFAQGDSEVNYENNGELDYVYVNAQGVEVGFDYVSNPSHVIANSTNYLQFVLSNQGSVSVNATLSVYDNTTSEVLARRQVEFDTDYGIFELLNWSPKILGAHHLTFTIQADDDVDTSNNHRQADILVLPQGPDLAGWVHREKFAYPNEQTTFDMRIYNTGSHDVDSALVTLFINDTEVFSRQVALSESYADEDDAEDAIEELSAFRAEKFGRVEFNWTAPHPGVFSYRLEMNHSEEIFPEDNVFSDEIAVIAKAPTMRVHAPKSNHVVAQPLRYRVTTDVASTCIIEARSTGVTLNGLLNREPQREIEGVVQGLPAATYDINFTCSVAPFNASTTISRTAVTLEQDTDGDRYPDSIDCAPHDAAINPGQRDRPNNGIDENCDGSDASFVKGRKENINHDGLDNPVNVTISGNDNLTRDFNDEERVSITDGNQPLIDFVHNFTDSELALNFTVEKSLVNNISGIVIADLHLQNGSTKTVYLPKGNASINTLCVRDTPILTLAQMSSDCSGADEFAFVCSTAPTTITRNGSDYTCTDLGNRYKVDGLKHSAVMEYMFTQPSSSSNTQAQSTPAGGGGGGGALAGFSTNTQTSEEPAAEEAKEDKSKKAQKRAAKPKKVGSGPQMDVPRDSLSMLNAITGAAVSSTGKPPALAGLIVLICTVLLGLSVFSWLRDAK